MIIQVKYFMESIVLDNVYQLLVSYFLRDPIDIIQSQSNIYFIYLNNCNYHVMSLNLITSSQLGMCN
jgi:hypothetical protein